MSIPDHYRSLAAKSTAALENLISESEELATFAKAHNFLADFELLQTAIQTRPESELFAFAIREYQFALFSASTSLYRQASISLRLFLELSLATVLFSAHEIRLRKWQNGTNDITWASLIDPDNGVFAKEFILAFDSGLEGWGKQYSALAERVYRECSEFVHGNLHTHNGLDRSLEFDRTMLASWVQRADAARLCVSFAFAARYLAVLPCAVQSNLEALMLENFGHVHAVQAIYGR